MPSHITEPPCYHELTDYYLLSNKFLQFILVFLLSNKFLPIIIVLWCFYSIFLLANFLSEPVDFSAQK